MTDKNLTDKEIIKVLEICSTYKGKCTDCPAFVKVDHSKFKQVLLGAIQIINHQNEEIERLKSRKSVIRKDLRCDSVDDVLNGTFSIESENCVACDIEEIKSEARKEFADLSIKRICEQVSAPTPSESYIVERCNQEIDNLLKEMESKEIEPE